MRARLLVALAALALWPAVARAVVTVQPERTAIPLGQVVFFDVYATNPDVAENERLNAYTIKLTAPTFTPSGVHFLIPAANPDGTISFAEPSAAHPYVFGAYPGNGPVDPTGLSDFQTVLLSAALGGTGQEANISDALSGFARVGVAIPPGTGEGFFPVLVDPEFLSLGSSGTPIIAVGAPGVIITPEPGALGLLGLIAPMALRRRRRA